MKILCDVCDKQEASVFCSADEAALCNDCDHRVHYANKLASKHQRFSLINPNPEQVPLCDICQGKRAFLFCQQDRAILCRDCDVSIHKPNELTKKHNRFLLTGIKLAAVSELSVPTVDDSVTNGCDLSVPDCNLISQPSIKKVASDSLQIHNPPLIETNIGSTSSISEYLIDMLPGWHVEDLLNSSLAPFGFYKSDYGALPFVDNTDIERNPSSISSENAGYWINKTPLVTSEPQYHNSYVTEQRVGFKQTKETATTTKIGNKKCCDDGFTVPQISPQSTRSSKRSRLKW